MQCWRLWTAFANLWMSCPWVTNSWVSRKFLKLSIKLNFRRQVTASPERRLWHFWTVLAHSKMEGQGKREREREWERELPTLNLAALVHRPRIVTHKHTHGLTDISFYACADIDAIATEQNTPTWTLHCSQARRFCISSQTSWRQSSQFTVEAINAPQSVRFTLKISAPISIETSLTYLR